MTSITPFQYPGLSKRGYVSAIDAPSPPRASRSKTRSSSGCENITSSKDNKLSPPSRSVLNPPKQAPSVWQIFFTDWLQKQKSYNGEDKKLNVAQEAKKAGHVYNSLSDELREVLQQHALTLKETYEREFIAWKRTLTPADIERENAFRAAQRKSGKSRRKNINDPNAPKRPLTAYFLFLQAIRMNPQMVKDVFGDATEPTRQSVLAAVKWRSMTEAEKQPYLDQASSAKLQYETDRKAYDEHIRSSNESAMASVFVSPSCASGSPISAQYHGETPGVVMHK
ncbi:hypothetical protein K439DRAFT_1626076 [Ramaria rubella]|nr:hypothetical protein K439DRAFT_1626076 [Ramaria rubella]